jgi:hypothetical protein
MEGSADVCLVVESCHHRHRRRARRHQASAANSEIRPGASERLLDDQDEAVQL